MGHDGKFRLLGIGADERIWLVQDPVCGSSSCWHWDPGCHWASRPHWTDQTFRRWLVLIGSSILTLYSNSTLHEKTEDHWLFCRVLWNHRSMAIILLQSNSTTICTRPCQCRAFNMINVDTTTTYWTQRDHTTAPADPFSAPNQPPPHHTREVVINRSTVLSTSSLPYSFLPHRFRIPFSCSTSYSCLCNNFTVSNFILQSLRAHG